MLPRFARYLVALLASLSWACGSHGSGGRDQGTTAPSALDVSGGSDAASADAAPNPARDATADGAGVDAGLGADVRPDGRPGQDAAPDVAFVMAPHEPFPQLPDQGGAKLRSIKLVTITFPNFAFEDTVKAFGEWVVTSDWYLAAGADYGLAGGTHQHVQLTDAAPTQLSSVDIETFLLMKLADGTTLPQVAAADDDPYVYAIYFPSQTTITDLFGGCADAGGLASSAYHESVLDPLGHEIAYAVIPTCARETADIVESTAGHEIIEAATDTHPLTTPAYQMPITSPWYAFGEVADLCEEYLGTTDSGFSVPLVWSNTEAAKNTGWPCIPTPSVPYFSVTTTPADMPVVAAGGTFQFTVKAWSSAPVAAWAVSAATDPIGTFDPQPSLSVSRMNNGDVATLTLQVPPGTAPGSMAWAVISSGDGQGISGAVWPVAIQVR